ncbi:hypothetical protein [Paenibacillus donghaensis]|uniref:hypothetical protein n=1 Tax=Paenibacillus donghaensis TaxID=414771 RepID=UPI001471EED9|nr:hypothetical protein [Paenibacillus donghaensis]
MEFTGMEEYALEETLKSYIKLLEGDIERWHDKPIADTCRLFLADAQSALAKIKER